MTPEKEIEILKWLVENYPNYGTSYAGVWELIKIVNHYHESEVKKLNEPAVSKSEGIERRNLLIDFGNRVVEIQNEHQCLLQNVEKEVDKYLKSINNC